MSLGGLLATNIQRARALLALGSDAEAHILAEQIQAQAEQSGEARLQIDDRTYELEADGGLRIEKDKERAVACVSGRIVLGSVTSVALSRT